MKYLIIAFTLLIASQVWAIKYYQGSGGAIKEIDAAAFGSCGKVYYRNAAKNELSTEHQKNLVKATLKGELVNDLQAVGSRLKAEDGACTYTENSESL